MVSPGLKTTLRPMDSRAFLRRVFEPALKKAGIQDASWNVLRHTTASRLVMAGVPLPTVKEVLGHRNIQTTMRYAHLVPSHIQAAMEKGSLSNIGLGTGSTTGSGVNGREEEKTQVVDSIGAPDRNRTCDHRLRRPMLYPTELRAHARKIVYLESFSQRPGRLLCPPLYPSISVRRTEDLRDSQCDTDLRQSGSCDPSPSWATCSNTPRIWRALLWIE